MSDDAWVNVAESLKPARDATDDEQFIISEVQAMALEWDASRLPLEALDRLCRDLDPNRRGEKGAAGAARNLTVRFTPPTDPVFDTLMRMLDVLIADHGILQTRHGAFTTTDVIDYGGIISYRDGVRGIRWPGERGVA